MKMKTILKISSAVFALAFGMQAQALSITPDDCSASGTDYILLETCWTTNDNSQPDAANLSALTGIPEADLEELYKANVGGTDGPWYDTTFDNEPLDPMDATITWLGGGYIDCSVNGCILVVKDGSQEPAVYVFDISSWDGQETIYLTGFWPNQGAISNVSIWGGEGSKVPEPGTLALLGLGLFGMGLMRRRQTS